MVSQNLESVKRWVIGLLIVWLLGVTHSNWHLQLKMICGEKATYTFSSYNHYITKWAVCQV